ncbi:TerB family tellurite resistance protein [Xinfangfangia sp. CPCC 101601]|uniref:TerB family tellurite resistance protein n=1 Tax=Pseudogemmobacter lacusdianii TaxID=3069608 RepID=A0ABU0VY76_9RHOB|nr:TerB family tellurite resistance protein [Xinfangfangia sp. CPCC 101601]MDQ2066717.1 TerB family tellurite resistance protein [Xinfangfangia sp. CPCC 101601]
MFGKMLEKLSGGFSRLSGRTDLLEGIAAAAALVAAADGDIEDEEVVAVLAALENHPVLSKSFKSSEIERIADTMLKRAKAGAAGRLGLMREIEEAKARSSVEDLEMLLVIAIDVSNSDGEMEPQEKVVLGKIAKTLNLNLSTYLDL